MQKQSRSSYKVQKYQIKESQEAEAYQNSLDCDIHILKISESINNTLSCLTNTKIVWKQLPILLVKVSQSISIHVFFESLSAKKTKNAK